MRKLFAAWLVCVAGHAHAQPAPAEPSPTEPEPLVAPAFAPWSALKLVLEVEVYSQGRYTSRAGSDLAEVRLDRGEVGTRLSLGPQIAAELRMETIRSAADGSALGIDGDSTVLRLKLAHVMAMRELSAIGLRLDASFGYAPDPWIRGLEDDYTLKPLSRTGSERFLAWPVADLALVARATLGPVRATVAVGNGEGQRFPERNSGKTTTAVVDVVPIATEHARLTVSGVVRDGSIGVASIRERRFGGGIGLVSPLVRAGGEVVFAQGLLDRADAQGLLVGGWADVRTLERLFLAVRAQTLGFSADDGRLSSLGGGVAVEPWRMLTRDGDRARGRMRVWLGVERLTASGGAMPLPGADTGDATIVMLIASATAPFALE